MPSATLKLPNGKRCVVSGSAAEITEAAQLFASTGEYPANSTPLSDGAYEGGAEYETTGEPIPIGKGTLQ